MKNDLHILKKRKKPIKNYTDYIKKVQEVKSLKRILFFLIWVGVIAITIFLYKKQLGAIPFFLLSIYFFIQAKKELINKPNQKVMKERGLRRRSALK